MFFYNQIALTMFTMQYNLNILALEFSKDHVGYLTFSLFFFLIIAIISICYLQEIDWKKFAKDSKDKSFKQNVLIIFKLSKESSIRKSFWNNTLELEQLLGHFICPECRSKCFEIQHTCYHGVLINYVSCQLCETTLNPEFVETDCDVYRNDGYFIRGKNQR